MSAYSAKGIIVDEVKTLDWATIEEAFLSISSEIDASMQILSGQATTAVQVISQSLAQLMSHTAWSEYQKNLVVTEKIMVYLSPDDPPPHWESLRETSVPRSIIRPDV